MKIVFLGASGAVGTIALNALVTQTDIDKIILLGRKKLSINSTFEVEQHIIDVSESESYQPIIENIDTAICTLGVGEPSKVSKDEFIKIDKDAVLSFAKVCKEKNVKHFQLLSSVGINDKSSNFYLRSKGELVKELIKFDFERLSIFQPSMILTPKNRYGISQAILLKVWPKLDFIFSGKLRKYRGIDVNILGTAMAKNIYTKSSKIEYLEYDQFRDLAGL